jgi:hypothetical protein
MTIIMNDFRSVFDDAFKEMNNRLNYIAFGILIAIFYMCTNLKCTSFAIQHKTMVIISSLFSILTLALNYICCTLQVHISEEVLLKGCSNWYSAYNEMRIMTNCIWYVMQFTIIMSIIIFLILAYNYFFKNELEYTYTSTKKQKPSKISK